MCVWVKMWTEVKNWINGLLDKHVLRMPGVASFNNGNVASRACIILAVQKNLYWLPCFLEFSFPMECDLLGSGIPGGGEAFNVV